MRRLLLSLALLILTNASFAQGNVFLNVEVFVTGERNNNVPPDLKLRPSDIESLASDALVAKGWNVVHSVDKATLGTEARIEVYLSKHKEGYTASLFFAGISKGTSIVSDKITRVPYNYKSELINSYDDPLGTTMRLKVIEKLFEWVEMAF